MRVFCGLMLLLACTANAWAQMEPCLAGADSPDCGIKITMSPPPKSPDDKMLWVPNQITIDVPMRLHPTKVQLLSGPTGTEVADAFKLFAETAHSKKVGNLVRFQLEIKNCPGVDNALNFLIVSPKLRSPIVVNYQPFQCQQHEDK